MAAAAVAAAAVPAVLDALIVGGGPAGLSAALCLARVGRRVLLLDAGHYRNQHAQHMHNVLGNDHTPPAAFRESGAQQLLARYSTVERRMGVRAEKVTLKQDASAEEQKAFPPLANVRVEIAAAADAQAAAGPSSSSSHSLLFARKLILATGVQDLGLPISGWQELWGSVIQFCPYCDGYEQRDGSWAVLVRSNAAERTASPELNLPAFPPAMYAHYVSMLYAFNPRLTLLTHGQKAAELFTAEQIKAFESKAIKIVEDTIEVLKGIAGSGKAKAHGESASEHGDAPVGLEVKLCGSSPPLQFRSLYSRPSYMQCALVRAMGLKLHPAFGTVEVDMFGHSSKQHVFVCGDAAQPMPSVPNAMASGGATGAGVNAEMAGEDMFGATKAH